MTTDRPDTSPGTPEPGTAALRWMDAAALADGAGDERLLDELGRIREPLLVVDLDVVPSPDVVIAAGRAAAGADRILVGVAAGGVPDPALAALVTALDVTLVPGPAEPANRELVAVPDPVSAAAELHRAVQAHPNAAIVLAGLLRSTGTLSVPHALDAESYAYSTLLGGPEMRGWLDRRGSRPPPPPAAGEPVLLERVGDELRITLNRPERRNAYGREVRDALVAALEVGLLDAGIGRIVLDGAGPAFCAGGDLDEFGTTPNPVTAHLVRTRAGAARLLHRLATRTEVRLHGACVGAGIELGAFACQVVAHADTTVQLPEVGMGLVPGAGGTVSIPRRIGRWRALHLALGGTVLDPRTALAWGLFDEIR